MFRVRAVYALTLGVLLAAAAQAQQPMPPGMMGPPPGMMQGPPPGMGGPMMGGPMMGGPTGGLAMFEPYGPGPMGPPSFDPTVQQSGYIGGGCGSCGGGGCGDCCGGQHFPMRNGAGQLECAGGCFGGDIGYTIPGPCPIIFNHEVEASFLYMDIDGTAAAGQLDAPAVPVAALYLSRDADLNSQLAVIPRIWLHAQKGCWGVGGRFWSLGESESMFTPLNLLSLNIIGNYSMERIHAQTGDLVATYSFHPGHAASFQFDVGLRWAEYENESLILANAAFTDAIAHTSGVASTAFDGTGLTAGVRGTIAVHNHVSVFWGVRGAVVWGDMTTAVQTAATAIYDVDPAAGAIDAAGTFSEEELYIGEAQLGIQWEHQLQCVPATAFFRLAGEYQHWEIDSLAFSQADSIVQVDVLPAGDVIIASSQAQASAPYVDMFGLSISAGLTW